MSANINAFKQQKSFDWHYEIDEVDIELKEKRFMDDEFEYYKSTKTKSKKKIRQDKQK
ncbi:hypothetical protein [Methylobacter sp. YRD-M1]|uniref:hypothetical protein n=1 Tax=Methylobacter sp. YRD-M1 TaxID=2911520 RepID=UPI00227C824C|nr:hypothetical protein [Methylobacter sp. YRD-M1]WAK00893.1 hypothetical protein LZ558_13695 [Methylobacter sp. YRD-M1]